MTVRDPRDAVPPLRQPTGDEASTGQEPVLGTPGPRGEWSGGTQTVGGSATPKREAGDSAHFPSPIQAEGKTPRDRAKPSSLQSIGDLLRTAYGGKFKRLNPKKAEIAAMRSAAKPEPSERQELLGLSASDRTLERTRELMLLCTERSDASILVGPVGEFVGEVLRHHPAFRVQSLAGVLENHPDACSEEGAVRVIASQSYTSLPWQEGLPPLKNKEGEQCRANALCCLMLWFRRTHGTSFERIQRYLLTNIWVPAAGHKTEPQMLRVLMSTRDPAGIAVACSALEKEAIQHRQQATTARMAEERAVMRAKGLEDELAGAEARLEATRAHVGRLTEELAGALRAHDNERANLRSDYEELRGRVLHRLREEVSLLDEGLHALRRDPPKVHVMSDHAERAIDGLNREIERLKGED